MNVHPKPKLLADIDHSRHAVIEASAGTGKTFTLEHLVIDLLLSTDCELRSILVVTFTEKAAAELRQRIQAKIARLLLPPTRAPAPDEPVWRIDAEGRERLRRAHEAIESASISTIHAFCQRTLSAHALDTGARLDLKVQEHENLFQEAFYRTLRRVLAHRAPYQRFLHHWLQDESIETLREMLLTCHALGGSFDRPFSLQAFERAVEDLARLPTAPQALRPQLLQSKLSAPATQRLLLRFSELGRALRPFTEQRDFAGVLKAVAPATDGDAQSIVESLQDGLRGVPSPTPMVHSLRDAVAALKSAIVPFRQAVVELCLEPIRACIEDVKEAAGLMDFDDMIVRIATSLQEAPRGGLARRLYESYEHILIDEFQDTDDAQWSIFRSAFLEPNPPRRLVSIGDPKQAIYQFRGAHVRTYQQATDHLLTLGAQRFVLQENFRSSDEMVRALNEVLDQSAPKPFFDGPVAYEHPVRAARGALALIDDAPTNGAVHVVHIPKSEEQTPPLLLWIQWVREEIRQLLSRPPALRLGDTRRPLSPSDIFILTRSTREGERVAEELRQHGIPQSFYKQEGLFQSDEARDILALLRAIAHPRRSDLQAAAYASPFFDIPLDRIQSAIEEHGEAFRRLQRWHERAQTERLGTLLASVVTESGAIERSIFADIDRRRATNYEHLIEFLDERTEGSGMDLDTLAHDLSDLVAGRRRPPGTHGNLQRQDSADAVVQIMTMHKSKGLEAPVVFVVGGFARGRGRVGTFERDGQTRLQLGPHPKVRRTQAEEDQRLLYVALTRAALRLYLPFVPDATARQMAGSYRAVHDRLTTLFDVDASAVPDGFVFRKMDLERFGAKNKASPAQLRDWTLSPWPEPGDADARPVYADRIVSSYSQMKASDERSATSDPTALPRPGEDEAPRPDLAPIQEHELPAGPAFGRFVHEMLETADRARLARCDESAWGADGEVRDQFLRALARHQMPAEICTDAMTLVHRAYRRPLQAPLELSSGLVGADELAHEVEFLFPTGPGQRSWLRGFIDLVVRHGSRYFILDWKTDRMPAYTAPVLAQHVESAYALQAMLYVSALRRHLGWRDAERFRAGFGGIGYFFVRGAMHPEAATLLHWMDVDYDELSAFESDLPARFGPQPPAAGVA